MPTHDGLYANDSDGWRLAIHGSGHDSERAASRGVPAHLPAGRRVEGVAAAKGEAAANGLRLSIEEQMRADTACIHFTVGASRIDEAKAIVGGVGGSSSHKGCRTRRVIVEPDARACALAQGALDELHVVNSGGQSHRQKQNAAHGGKDGGARSRLKSRPKVGVHSLQPKLHHNLRRQESWRYQTAGRPPTDMQTNGGKRSHSLRSQPSASVRAQALRVGGV